MNKFTIIAVLLLLACVGIHAQGLTLSLDITAGGLKAAMTSEQKKAVTNLTLTGSMNDSDFYLIRDSMPELKILDIKSVEVDTIPARAFYGSGCETCTLPINLKYIGDGAFRNTTFQTIIITGAFPKLGYQVIEKGINSTTFIVGNDNTYCSQNLPDYNIYSHDGNTCYLQQGDSIYLRDGTEIIDSRAFDNSSIFEVRLPSSVKLIKEYAFADIRFPRLLFKYYNIVCFASVPPVLEENAFADETLFEGTLYVPYESVNLYKQSNSQWSRFRIITGIHAQGLAFSLDITAGGLKDVIVVEDRKIVTSLTLTGSMNDSDFYLIRDSMPELKTLNIKNAQVDTIPVRAFYGSGCKTCILPVNLKYIGDKAFQNTSFQTILVTGPFPKLGSQVIEKDLRHPAFIISKDNLYCSQYNPDYDIYSADESIFYFQQGNETFLRDGVEIIESRAFDNSPTGALYRGVEFPVGLKLIKEYAFANINGTSFNGLEVVCHALIPPVLEDYAFADERVFEATLYVPEKSVDLYKESQYQWSKFHEIIGMFVCSIENNEKQLSTKQVYNGWQITAEKSIQSAWVTDSSGMACSFSMPDGRHIFLSSDKNKRQLYLVKIVFEDGTSESLKLLN